MDKIALRTSFLCLQDGARLSRPASLYVDAANARQREARGALFVLLEPAQTRSAPPALLAEITHVVSSAYYAAGGSVTRGLRGALLAANTTLFQRNLQAPETERTLLGINCIVVRGQDAYVGQMGPALLYLQHRTDQQGVLTRYPETSAWIRSADPSLVELNREPPAGLRAEIEPSLSHVWLQPGDALIMASTALARLAPAAELARAVSAPSVDATLSGIEQLARDHDLSAILIEASGAALRHEPSAAIAAEAPERPTAPAPSFLRPSAARQPASARETAPAKAAQAEPTTSPARQPGRPAAAEPEQAGASLDALKQGAQQARKRTEDWLMRVLPTSVPAQPSAEQTTDTRTPAARGTGRKAARARGSSRQRAARPSDDHTMPGSGRALVSVALLIPLVVVALVVATRVRYERTRTSQFDLLQVQAQAAYSEALELPNEGQMREALNTALGLAQDGLSVHPNDETLVSLTRRIQHKLNEIDIVQPLFHFWKLTDLDDLNTSDAARVVLQDSNLFVLNRGSDRVYHYRLNDVGDALQPIGNDSVLVQAGETRGGILLSEMVDIAWLEAGGGRTLSTFVTLEAGGTLLAYNPQLGIDALPVADSAGWLMPQAIGGFFGNLYVLDPLLGRILKYTPTDNSYTNPPGDYLANELATDLTGAVDMAIDGNVYVLFADGRIVKFLQGEVLPFKMDSLPSPMRSPMCMFVSGEKDPDAPGYVYVADTGNDRIVQFDKQGNYVRQFRAQSGEVQLTGVRGLYVDEARGRIFFVSGRTLWLADIPALVY